MYFYLYKTINIINGKFYIGVHQTENLNDGYIGSGKHVNSAIKKYGIDNFKIEILEFFDDSKSMYNREKEIVTEEFISRSDTYNIRMGGSGGFDYIQKMPQYRTWTRLGAKKSIRLLKEQGINFGKLGADSCRINKKGVAFDPILEEKYNFRNNKQNQELGNSPEAREKAKITQKTTYAKIKHQQGCRNSQYGTRWVYNGIKTIKIKKEELQKYLDLGWKPGRRH